MQYQLVPQNAVDLAVFKLSSSIFLDSLSDPLCGLKIEDETSDSLVFGIYGFDVPSVQVGKNMLSLLQKNNSVKFSGSSKQTLGDLMEWLGTKNGRVEAQKRLRFSGIVDSQTRKESTEFALRVLQNKFGRQSVASCALAACFLMPTTDNKFRRELQKAAKEVGKKGLEWIAENYPGTEGVDKIEIYRNVVTKILLSRKSAAMDERVAFWAPPALV